MGERRTHPCPGRCGADVPDWLFTCRTCWFRLPRDLQRPILDTAGRSLLDPSRQDAVMDAVQWYGEQEDRHAR